MAFVAAGLVLGAALAYSLYTNPEWKTFSVSRFWANFREADWLWLGLAAGAIYGSYAVRALRWKIFLDPIKPDASFGNLLSTTVVGFGAMGILGRPAEIVRPYLIARKEQTPISSQLAIWVIERSFDMLILLAGLVLALGQMHIAPGGSAEGWAPWLPGWWNPLTRVVGVTIVGLLVLLIVLRGYYDELSARLVARLRVRLHPRAGGHWAERLGRLADKLALFGEGLRSLRQGRSLALTLLLSIANWTLIAFCFRAVLVACVPQFNLGVSEVLVFMGLVMVGSMFQLPGIGRGVQCPASAGNGEQRSAGKLTEGTHEESTETLHSRREGRHPETASAGQGAGLNTLRRAGAAADGVLPLAEGVL